MDQKTVTKKVKKKKKRTGVKVFIVLGLAGIVAASAWIMNTWNAEQQKEIGKADAEYISEASQAISAPEVKVRENASGNYHVISHRGYPAKAEESSFEGYDLAIKAGSMYIETDLVMSADGTLYVSHDDTPARLTGASGSFSSMSDEEIDKLETYGGNKILKFTDVLEKYGKTVGYVVELKGDDEETINAFCDAVEHYAVADDVIVQSFESGVLDAIEKKYPDMTKMYLCRTPDDRSRGIGLASADIVCINRTYMNEYGLNAVHNAGKKFAIWTVESDQHIIAAIQLGVDMYFTDNTERALELEKQYRNEQNKQSQNE